MRVTLYNYVIKALHMSDVLWLATMLEVHANNILWIASPLTLKFQPAWSIDQSELELMVSAQI